MAFGLLKYGLSRRRPVKRFLSSRPELRPSYDVAIIGGGGHGLAAAYYLAARHGVRNVAVFDKGYLGGGNTGRNTAIIRSNYLTPEGVAFYEESMRLYRGLSEELDYNILYSERGHFTLAHSDAAMRTSRWRAEVNKHLGVDSELVGREELARLVPLLNMSEEVRHPILGALYHPPGALARHDAVAWGYAGRAQELGVEIHQETEVTGIKVENGRVTGLETSRGPIACGKAMQAVAGLSGQVARLAGFTLPIRTVPLQACVSLPLKPFLDPIIVSGSLHVYISQSDRGELVMGGATDPYPRYQTSSTLDFMEGLMAHILELFPFMGDMPGAAPVGRHDRHDARLRAGHGADPGRELLHRFGLGHLGLQGDARLRHQHGGADRDRPRARADRGLPPRPFPRLLARGREGRGLGRALGPRVAAL